MGNRRNFLRNATSQSARIAALAGFILLASNGSSASANDRMSFREFRQQNDGLAKSAARQLFREQFGRHNTASSGGQFGITYQPNLPTVNFGAGGEPIFASKNIAGLKRVHEPRVRNQSMQELSSGNITRVNRGVDLDLGSGLRNIVLGRALFDSNETVSISVGGKTENFSAGSKVTAAEYVAVKQVLSGGGQQVEVDRNGRASGGSVDLGALTSDNDVMRASSLVVPKDVTTIGDFGRGSDFRLTGDLSNFGTVQTLSTNTSVRGGTIHADNIDNHSGALISARGDLSLDASNNLTNYGVIAASGKLSLSAGGAVSNSGTVAAGEDLSVTSTKVLNRGSLNANSGNVSFATTGGDLVIDNRGGSIVATDGSINVRASDYAGSANSLLVGGDLLSRELNLNSGLGTATVNANKLTGVVNETGSAAHVWAETDTLSIGNVCLTGDPTYFNRGGNIIVVGDVIVQEDLTLVASGSIASIDPVNIIAGDANRGYNITMIAGASFTAQGGLDNREIGPDTSPLTSGVVTINSKGTKTGGVIAFADGSKISSRSTDVISSGDRDGGDVQFFLFGKTDGYINLIGVDVETGGVNQGSNGNFLIANEHSYKGYTYSTIGVGNIDTTNQTGGPQGINGNVLISGSKPIIVGGKTVTYGVDGALVGPAHFEAGESFVKGSGAILLPGTSGSAVIDAAGDVNITSDLFFNGGTIQGKNIGVSAGLGMSVYDSTSIMIAQESISFETSKGGFIGDSQFMTVETPSLHVNNPSGVASIFVQNTGTTNVDIETKILRLIADQADLTGRMTAADDIHAVAASFNLDPGVTAGSVIEVTSTVAPLVDDGTIFISPTLILSAENIGSSVNPFLVNAGTKTVSISSAEAFVSSLSTKKGVSLGASNVNNLVFDSLSGVKVTGDVFALDSLTIKTAAGTLSVDENVHLGSSNELSILNSGTTKKDKIIFGEGSAVGTIPVVAGDGNITIQLGSASSTPASPPDNVVVSGSVQILGLGFSAKGSSNALMGTSSTITVSNSVATKNILLGGNVIMFASQQ